jgi:hypothetical protein
MGRASCRTNSSRTETPLRPSEGSRRIARPGLFHFQGHRWWTPNTLEKVLEKLAVTDKTTIVVERQPDGKMRVTSGSWEGEKVFLRDQVLEVRNVESHASSP